MDLPMLPLVQARGERADAARNRLRVLASARELVDRHGVDHVTVDDVAAAAGVGKGTVFRRFGDRAGLMSALLDETEQQFQAAFMTGPPPLGPGADAVERLRAFGRAKVAMIETYGDLIRAADGGSGDSVSQPARGLQQLHVRLLLAEAGVEGDLALLADTMLTALDHRTLLQRHRAAAVPLDRLALGWEDLVRRLVA